MPDAPPYLQVDLVQQGPISLDAHFQCEAGEVLALVGPSGSGKSTILKSIAGLYQPKEGRIAVGGQEWLNTNTRTRVPARQRSVGMVFQDYALFPHLTALANVAEAMQHIPANQRSARAADLLARVHMDALANRKPHTLSGGQQQRVAVARALARDPKVLLLDEPFSAVDQVTKESLYEELAVLRRGLAIPVILVTHALDEAMRLADRMCVLHRGVSLQLASPEEVMSRPATLEVAQLLARRNVFAAVVSGHQNSEATFLDWNGVELQAPFDGRFKPGEQVHWTIPDSHIVMHRTGKAYRATTENLLEGIVTSVLTMGSITQVKLQPASNPNDLLSFSVPSHFASLNNVKPGIAAEVSVRRDELHLMPKM